MTSRRIPSEPATPAATIDPAPTADSPVATDEELERAYEIAGGYPFDFPDALRAVYNLGRVHGARRAQAAQTEAESP